MTELHLLEAKHTCSGLTKQSTRPGTARRYRYHTATQTRYVNHEAILLQYFHSEWTYASASARHTMRRPPPTHATPVFSQRDNVTALTHLFHRNSWSGCVCVHDTKLINSRTNTKRPQLSQRNRATFYIIKNIYTNMLYLQSLNRV